MAEGARVLFRVAAGPRMGFGHLVRAASLARALGVRSRVTIRGGALADATARRLGMEIVPGTQPLDVLRREHPDVLVVDDRVAPATRAWRAAARACGVHLASVHDLGIGTGDTDLFIDGSVGATSPRSNHATSLVGPRYAIIDPRVAGLRARGASKGEPRRAVITLGGGPRRSLALQVARELLRRDPSLAVCVAGGLVGNDAGTEGRIEWIAPERLRDRLASATVAVVSGGVTLYEACALGVPAVAVAIVRSQLPTVRGFARRGAIVNGGLLAGRSSRRKDAIRFAGGAAVALCSDTRRRRELSRTAQALVDGQGALRVAAAIRRLAGTGGRPTAIEEGRRR